MSLCTSLLSYPSIASPCARRREARPASRLLKPPIALLALWLGLPARPLPSPLDPLASSPPPGADAAPVRVLGGSADFGVLSPDLGSSLPVALSQLRALFARSSSMLSLVVKVRHRLLLNLQRCARADPSVRADRQLGPPRPLRLHARVRTVSLLLCASSRRSADALARAQLVPLDPVLLDPPPGQHRLAPQRPLVLGRPRRGRLVGARRVHAFDPVEGPAVARARASAFRSVAALLIASER